jgi:hypothetical protein
MGQVAITTPVTQAGAGALKTFLNELPRDTPPTADGPVPTAPSPFTGALPPTHFARFVVIELDDDASHLLFTSAFDGDTSEYLRALAATATAQAIWSHCQLPQSDRALTRSELERYLCDECNWRPAQYVVNALPDGVTVDAVNRALSLRAQLGALMMRAGVMEPTALAHDFRQLPAIQALMRR